MAKERLIAIFIGLLMIMSAAGFALNSAMNQGDINTTPQITVPTINTRPLTAEETVNVLNYDGKVIIEYSYQNHTVDQNKIAVLESFAQQNSGFVVLSEYLGNETSMNMIGIQSGQGKIVNMSNMTLSEANLMDLLCDVAIALPQECLMRE